MNISPALFPFVSHSPPFPVRHHFYLHLDWDPKGESQLTLFAP